MAQHFGDHKPLPQSDVPHYSSDVQGNGRWVWLTMLGERVGCLITSPGAICWVGLPINDVPASHHVGLQVNAGLREAAAVGAAIDQVFDSWADRSSQGIAAEGIQYGDVRGILLYLNA